MTEFERKMRALSPEDRKKAQKAMGEMMGMPIKKRRKPSNTKKSGKK